MPFSVKGDYTLSHALTRGGVNIPFGLTEMTPFFELGGYFYRGRSQNDWAYGAIGGKMRSKILPVFDIGLDLKMMRRFYSYFKSTTAKSSNFGIGAWGYQLDLPLIWHIRKTWDVEVAPYLLQLDARTKDLTIGSQFMVGYSF